ncbi:MAG: UPF0079 ATP-binding protein [Bacteroidetes bacterium]|nr:MAG: UPF0079 ATP-binding protein [Bacteroidota bacterium]
MKLRADSVNDLQDLARKMLESSGDRRVFAFSGQMGAGKTTFIKALCKTLGVTDTTSSPTFALVNEYRTKNGEPVYHFDCYRLRKPEEAFDIGFEEYVNSGSYCFIEWPEMLGDLLPEDAVQVNISLEGEARIFELGDY